MTQKQSALAKRLHYAVRIHDKSIQRLVSRFVKHTEAMKFTALERRYIRTMFLDEVRFRLIVAGCRCSNVTKWQV